MNDIKIINNISPLRYPGGKTRACKVLDKILIKHFNINNIENIISPFFGGGSFEFFLQNNYKVNLIVNDKFKPLYSFWNQCKSNKNNLIEEIKKNKDVDKEKFKNFREEKFCKITIKFINKFRNFNIFIIIYFSLIKDNILLF
jgi:DNA adenine methylase